jgi:hypothetical protein
MHTYFQGALGANAAFDEVDFHAHGSPGVVCIGNDDLTWGEPLKRFENQGFERLFKPGAAISFKGCNCGEGATGEFLLTEIARVFLRTGGTVQGNTGFGLNIASSPHPFGSWVTAKATPGAAVTLSGHTHLAPHLVAERLTQVERMIAASAAGGRKSVDQARQWLDQARRFQAAAGTFFNMYWAWHWSDRASEEIAKQDLIGFGQAPR